MILQKLFAVLFFAGYLVFLIFPLFKTVHDEFLKLAPERGIFGFEVPHLLTQSCGGASCNEDEQDYLRGLCLHRIPPVSVETAVILYLPGGTVKSGLRWGCGR